VEPYAAKLTNDFRRAGQHCRRRAVV